MRLSLAEFHCIGREQRFDPGISLPARLLSCMVGALGLHSRVRAGHAIKAIKKMNLPEDARVLDAGCGRGMILFWLSRHHSNYQLHGIEQAHGLVARNEIVARRLEKSSLLTFAVGDLLSVDLGTATYDLIVSVDVLEHIGDDTLVLQKFRRALRPEGVLLLHLPLRHQLQSRIFPGFKRHRVDSHVRDEYLPNEIESKLELTGFQMTGLSYGFGDAGELAFELNNLFWGLSGLRAVCALMTYPLAWLLAYRDVNNNIARGNSMIIKATPVPTQRD